MKQLIKETVGGFQVIYDQYYDRIIIYTGCSGNAVLSREEYKLLKEYILKEYHDELITQLAGIQ